MTANVAATTETHLHEAGPPDLTDLNFNGVPDYIDEVGAIADSVRNVLVEVILVEIVPIWGMITVQV